MEKAEFIKLSPAYYALAIVAAVAEGDKHLMHDSLIERFAYSGHRGEVKVVCGVHLKREA